MPISSICLIVLVIIIFLVIIILLIFYLLSYRLLKEVCQNLSLTLYFYISLLFKIISSFKVFWHCFKCKHMLNCYVFLMHWPLYHYVMSVFISENVIFLSWNLLWNVTICSEYLFHCLCLPILFHLGGGGGGTPEIYLWSQSHSYF